MLSHTWVPSDDIHSIFVSHKLIDFLLVSTNQCDSEKNDEISKADANANADVHVTENDEESGEEPVIELTETSNNEIGIECDNDNDQEHLQLTVIDSDKLDTSNIDNEDSLNLTIGEEEAKIFQDEVVISIIFYCHWIWWQQ